MKSTIEIIRNWFDLAEVSLEKEAIQASLFDHPTMIGSAREFLIKRVLKSVLPPFVHIGSGKIIDSIDKSSRQIDIIIYDSRFPIFEIEQGIGTYLIEGVIATIEVKSNLSEIELKSALENTLSVLSLSILLKENTKIEDTKRLVYNFLPSNYIFAYKSELSQKKLRDIVDDWYKEKHKPAFFKGRCAALPRMILAGNKIGILDDGIINIDPGEDVLKKWKELGNSDPKVIVGFWEIKHRFGFLMIHLLKSIFNRFPLIHKEYNIEYTVDGYLNKIDYFKTEIDNKLAEYCIY